RPSSPVALYLAGRGLTLPVPSTLRYAPALWRRDGPPGPAMIARIDGPDGTPIGIHRTWLERTGPGQWRRREPKMMLGQAKGGAVRLARIRENAPLVVAEGIETTLAGMQATGIGGWAALSTSGLEALALPRDFGGSLILLADHDRNGAGEKAAREAAHRW